nr:MAG TPA: hypothetical protein [Caudoviricetes sp.]
MKSPTKRSTARSGIMGSRVSEMTQHFVNGWLGGKGWGYRRIEERR